MVIIKQFIRLTKKQKAALETKNEIFNLIETNMQYLNHYTQFNQMK